eukprot:1780920-Prymnesium_polylepis.1
MSAAPRAAMDASAGAARRCGGLARSMAAVMRGSRSSSVQRSGWPPHPADAAVGIVAHARTERQPGGSVSASPQRTVA